MLIGTPASRAVCQKVAAQSDGAILLGFSRGKDSVAAWLWLREFFPRIIPFHLSAVPGLEFVERSLDYYESVFETKIIRMVSGELTHAIATLVYQPVEDEDWIDGIDFDDSPHTNESVVRDLRRQHGTNLWAAWGISATDSIVRRSAKKYRDGHQEKSRTLYPCFDWTRSQIVNLIETSGIRLPEDYLLSCRSFAGIPSTRHLPRMKELFPDDFERVKLFYPLIEAVMARNEFRRMTRESQSSEKILSVPLTGNGSISRTLPSTNAKDESISGEQQAAATSDGKKSRQSKRSTKHKATPIGLSP